MKFKDDFLNELRLAKELGVTATQFNVTNWNCKSDLIINSISLQPLLFGAAMNLRHVTRYETPAKERVLWLIRTAWAML